MPYATILPKSCEACSAHAKLPQIVILSDAERVYTRCWTPQGGEEKEDSEAVVEKEINKDGSQRLFGAPMFLPFFSAPTSYWVHLDAPPPGPHAALIAIRLAGTDRVLAVDALGIFHSFRWAWKPEASSLEDEMLHPFSYSVGPIDKGCFVAQRELPRFRIVPRLVDHGVVVSVASHHDFWFRAFSVTKKITRRFRTSSKKILTSLSQ
jgi:hypothetical protein